MRISISKIVYTLVVLQRGFVFIFQEEKEKSKQVNQVVAQWDANKRMQQRAEKQNRRAERIRKMKKRKLNFLTKRRDINAGMLEMHTGSAWIKMMVCIFFII